MDLCCTSVLAAWCGQFFSCMTRGCIVTCMSNCVHRSEHTMDMFTIESNIWPFPAPVPYLLSVSNGIVERLNPRDQVGKVQHRCACKYDGSTCVMVIGSVMTHHTTACFRRDQLRGSEELAHALSDTSHRRVCRSVRIHRHVSLWFPSRLRKNRWCLYMETTYCTEQVRKSPSKR